MLPAPWYVKLFHLNFILKWYAYLIVGASILHLLIGSAPLPLFLAMVALGIVTYLMYLSYKRWLLTVTSRGKHIALGSLMFIAWPMLGSVPMTLEFGRADQTLMLLVMGGVSYGIGHLIAGKPLPEPEYDELYLGKMTHQVLLQDTQQPFSDNIVPAGTLIPKYGDLLQPDHLRVRHTYIIGKTGKGKSNLLAHLILQDIYAGRGVGVLAPEVDIFRSELLPRIPSNRIKDVIYFNPEDQDQPLIYNPFHLDRNEQLHLKAAETFAVFERAMADLTGARMRPILTNAIYALCERPNSTVHDLERLLDPYDPSLRQEIIEISSDERTRKFWRDTYGQFPDDAALPLLNRLDDFLRPPVSTVLGAHNPSVSLDFRAAMDHGKILFFNLSTGLLGEKVSQTLGQLIVAKIQQTIWSREAIPKDERRPFYFYIDEFQTYTSTAAQSYSDILAKARKYGLALYLAHQQTQQIPSNLFADILGNVSTLCVLTTSMMDASKLSKELFIKDPKLIAQLEIGQCFVKLDTDVYKALIPLVRHPKSDATRDAAIASSKALYGVRAVPTRSQPSRPPESNPRLSGATQKPVSARVENEDEDFLHS